MITLKTLTLTDFLSHQNTTVNLEKRGLCLIAGTNADAGGSNGAGKSGVAEGILWGLFGVTSRGLKADEVIRNGTASCAVEISGEKDGSYFHVLRTRGPANLVFTCGDIDISGASIKATQSKLEEYLGLDAAAFTSAVLFPQGAIGLAALSAPSQRAIFNQILNLDRFDAAFERVKERKFVLDKEIQTTNNQLISSAAVISTFKHQITVLENAKHDFHAQQERAVEVLQQKLNALTKPRELTAEERESISNADSAKAYSNILAEQAFADQAYNRDLASAMGEQGAATGALGRLREPQNRVKDACPTCGASFSEESREEALKAYRADLAQYLADKKFYEEQADKAKELIRRLKAAKAMADKEISNKLNEARLQAQAVEQLMLQNRKAQEYDEAVKALNLRISEERAKEWTGDALIKQNAARLKDELSLQDELKEKLVKQEEEQRYVDFWHQGFGSQGVKHYYLASITPFLSERATFYLKAITGGVGEISVTTQRETKKGTFSDELTISAIIGEATTYEAASGGEKQRINLALLFALAELMATRARVQVNLLFLDEAWENIDLTGVQQLFPLLKEELGSYKESIFVVTHNDVALAGEFDDVISVTKRHGISHVDG